MIRQDPSYSLAGWYFTEEEFQSALIDGRMLCPSIDLSNPCNLNCPYCYVEERNSTRKSRKPSELTVEETRSVLQDLRSCGARTINIVGAGEPTIDPHFKDTVQLIADLGMATVLFTNGIQLCKNSRLTNFLYERDVTVVLKFNSSSRMVQDLVAGLPGYAAQRDRALDQLVEAGFSATVPTRLGLDTMVFKGNVDEIPEIHRSCRRRNFFPITGDYIPTGRTDGGEFHGFSALIALSETDQQRIVEMLQPISQYERLRLIGELAAIDRSLGIVSPSTSAYFGGNICTQLLGLYVDIEGNIWPCVARKKVVRGNVKSGLLGNVRKGDTPSRIWKSSHYMRQIRDSYTGACPYKPRLITRDPLRRACEQVTGVR